MDSALTVAFLLSLKKALNNFDVLAAGLGLLAFVMALYLLAAREQKTPYITNSVYSTAIVVLLAILLSFASKFFESRFNVTAAVLSLLSVVLFAVGIIIVFFRVWKARNRKLNFRDDNSFKNLGAVRWIKNAWRSFRSKPSYAHDPARFQEPLVQGILRTVADKPSALSHLKATLERNAKIEFPLSISGMCRVSTFSGVDDVLTKLALCFLNNDCWVQYATCARHPVEFVWQLRAAYESDKSKGKDWREVSNQIIAVDAYSPHFGFADTIHDRMTGKLKQMGIECLTAKASYAGVHTAAARAFNKLRLRSETQQGGGVRKPTLTIYEGVNAIVDLESAEQYRIFIRHVLPSERLWGGMFTFIVEAAIADHDLALLLSYVDFFLDLRQNGETVSNRPERRTES
jgi:hypothetical protein